MSVGEQIKKVRLAKGLSQKEVVMGAGIDKAQFSRIENDKIDPSFSTIEKIAKAMGCSIAELFASAEELKDINSHDKSLMEKLMLIETLSEEEKQQPKYKGLDHKSDPKSLKEFGDDFIEACDYVGLF